MKSTALLDIWEKKYPLASALNRSKFRRLSAMYNSLYQPQHTVTSLITVLQINIFKCKLQVPLDTTPCRLLNIRRRFG
jgi:hypothetical protein